MEKKDVRKVYVVLIAVIASGSACNFTRKTENQKAGTNPGIRTQKLSPTQEAKISGTREIVYRSGELELEGYLCVPEGNGPFPAVVYNHGGVEDQIGGAPRETCELLATEGYVGFSPIRRATRSMDGHIDDVFAAVEYVKSLAYVDIDRIGIMGFSRGGLLTFIAITQRADFKGAILMAPAPGGHSEFEKTLAEVGKISTPVLILIAEIDTEPNDLVPLSNQVKEAMEAEGKDVEMILYPPYGEDGHTMFFEIGDYWRDVQRFWSDNLSKR